MQETQSFPYHFYTVGCTGSLVDGSVCCTSITLGNGTSGTTVDGPALYFLNISASAPYKANTATAVAARQSTPMASCPKNIASVGAVKYNKFFPHCLTSSSTKVFY